VFAGLYSYRCFFYQLLCHPQAALGGRDAAGAGADFSAAGGAADANGAVKVVDGGPAATAGAGLVYVCNLCDITATSPENLEAHFRGANHR